MNLPLFIAQRIARNEQASFSKFIIRLAILATALSVAIMIVAVAVLQGFKKNIEQKLFVFWDDVHIATYAPSGILGNQVMQQDKGLEQKIKKMNEVTHIYPYALKPAIVKGTGPITGLKFKGITPEYALKSTASIAFNGKPINFSDTAYAKDIILSENIINRLALSIGDPVYAYFIEPGSTAPRIRKLDLVGSFQTGVGEVDNSFALVDIRMIQRLNNWSNRQISGYQIGLSDNENARMISKDIYENYVEEPLTTETVRELYPGIFSWMDVQNVNAQILIIIMAIVAIINIATALLIFILERTQMIGILKSLGMNSRAIQKVFLTHASIISLKGIFWGTIIAVVICYLQMHFKFVKLDEEIYYMKYAPIHWSWINVIIIDVATLIFCFLLMIIPSYMVRKVNIVQALKFS